MLRIITLGLLLCGIVPIAGTLLASALVGYGLSVCVPMFGVVEWAIPCEPQYSIAQQCMSIINNRTVGTLTDEMYNSSLASAIAAKFLVAVGILFGVLGAMATPFLSAWAIVG